MFNSFIEGLYNLIIAVGFVTLAVVISACLVTFLQLLEDILMNTSSNKRR